MTRLRSAVVLLGLLAALTAAGLTIRAKEQILEALAACVQ
jgi:hypothetical protein